MTLTIGLTGSIATGKSTVSTMFKKFGIPVIDADLLAREVVEPGEEAYVKIRETFGDAVIQEDQRLDRQKLGELVFTNEHNREQLNKIVHPAVRERMLQQKKSYEAEEVPCIVLDIPLLFESKLSHLADIIVVVYVDEDVQTQRLMQRNGLTETEASQRMAAQMPVKEKAERADHVIDNNGTKQQTYEQLDKLLGQLNVI
ncbi:dephospho-CoA kinase [Virgibacillus xinjiangensis]|uniref:Dephospho-CoA kinase n=1 Tax=Virgibacillus xinjiangensis TaxID=393090 RepID=A0ABV7CVG2_9BACI